MAAEAAMPLSRRALQNEAVLLPVPPMSFLRVRSPRPAVFCIVSATLLVACVRASGRGAPTAAPASTVWSFRPVVRPPVPTIQDPAWLRNPVDAFIRSRLDAVRLPPAAEADRATLIRRVTFDVIGLPPSPQEVRNFVADQSPDAYERLVDRLLASPHYGERWGRHWLDVARFTQGRISFPGVKNTRGDQAYRDYVVRALNKDKPYDRFVVEQLAGDLLPPSDDREQQFDQITAPAFLSIGNWFDQCTDPNRLRLEMVDDMVSTTAQAFMGLTVGCARCHDHKTDPIPTADYYALGGVFRSTRIVGDFSEYWRDGRVRLLRPLAMPREVAANDQLRAEVAAKHSDLWTYLSDQHARLSKQWKADEPRFRAAAAQIRRPFVRLFEAEQFDGQDNLRIADVSRDGKSVQVIETQTPLAQWVKYKLRAPVAGSYRLEALYSSQERAPLAVQVNGKTVSTTALGEPTGGWDLARQRWEPAATFDLKLGLNFVRLAVKDGSFPRLDRFRLIAVDASAEQQVREAAEANGLNPLLLTNFVVDPQNPWPTVAETPRHLDALGRADVARRTAAIDALAATVRPYPLVVSVTDQPKPADLPVHLRGDTYAVSDALVSRGVPGAFDAALPRPVIPAEQSGRLQLAQWLTDTRHPLTARVMVNRIWQGHFGRGLVRTPSDFGKTGDAPTHPELLDWLAAEFMASGWSMKHVHRLILTSSTYRVSSEPSAEAAKLDPDNKLLSHASRRRLEAEAIYDAMRVTTNMIVPQTPGEPLDVERSGQRALYVLTSGKVPPGLGGEVRKFFRLFDYDMTGVALPVRPASSTPAQSLFFLNNRLPKWMADRFADRLLKMDRLSDAKRVEMAYLLALGRPPDHEIVKASLDYIAQCQAEAKVTPVEAWSRFCVTLYGSAEFRYVD
jgi:hypothetical protein